MRTQVVWGLSQLVVSLSRVFQHPIITGVHLSYGVRSLDKFVDEVSIEE